MAFISGRNSLISLLINEDLFSLVYRPLLPNTLCSTPSSLKHMAIVSRHGRPIRSGLAPDCLMGRAGLDNWVGWYVTCMEYMHVVRRKLVTGIDIIRTP